MENLTPSRTPVLALRQHQAIEHATMTLLSQRVSGVQLVARSDLQGFILYGDVDTGTLKATAEEALARLQHGQSGLALHPNCGTNLVAAGVLSGLAALAASGGQRRSLWERVPSAVLGATVALVVAMPLGRWLQAHVTTSAQVHGLRIVSVTGIGGSAIERHRVTIAA